MHKGLKIKISFVKTGIKTGTGGRILKLKNKFQKEENFLLVYGDGLYDANLTTTQQHNKSKKIVTMTITRPKTDLPAIAGIT